MSHTHSFVSGCTYRNITFRLQAKFCNIIFRLQDKMGQCIFLGKVFPRETRVAHTSFVLGQLGCTVLFSSFEHYI